MADATHLYSGIIKQAAARYGIPEGVLIRQIQTESGGNPHARSPVGALGLMQLMPATARGLGVENPLDPRENIMGGAKYLRDQINHFGSLRKALAAYNAGPAAVTKYGGVPPFAETQAYVHKILGGLPNVGAAPQESPPALAASAGMGVRAPTPPSAGPNFLSMARQLATQGTQGLGTTADTPDDPNAVNGLQAPQVMNWQQFLPRQRQAPQQQQLPQQAQQAQQGQQGKGNDLLPDMGTLGLHGGLQGQVPMITGNAKAGEQRYPNLVFSGHTDWAHVNPRLLKAVDAAAKRNHTVATIISGYRSNKYSAKVGGFAGDPHSKGIAVDAYINGHPIGDVIPPDEWAKLGIRSGNTPGFYQGKADPEHLDLVGLPHKARKR